MTKPGGDSSKPTALFLSPEAPYPLAGGGALRSAALLNYLAQRYTVHLVVFREPMAPEPANALPPGLVSQVRTIPLPFHARTPAARVARNVRRYLRGVPPLVDRFSGFDLPPFNRDTPYDLAVIEHSWAATYHTQLAPIARRVVLDLHNIESVLHARSAAAGRGPAAIAHRRFAACSRTLERDWLPKFDLVLAPSDADAAQVREIAPATKAAVYPNTIPAVAAPERQEMDIIAFSGNMEYHPNTAAVHYFRREIWPGLRERFPGLNWVLLGKNPLAVAGQMEDDPRIRVLGGVENAIDALALAKVAVAPLLAGSGTRIKILEAWAAGVPVVSTTIGAEGLPARHGEHLLIADQPAEFARAVAGLLESEELRRRLGAAGRALYEAEFTWEAGWRRLGALGI